MALKSMNYKVLGASDGLDAIDIFVANQNEISLIIMDVVMPKLGGVKAVERIREIRPDIKVIFSTGYDKRAVSRDNMPSDGSATLSKPYNIVELSKTIRNLLGSRN
ncbi:MAG: response regulator [Mariprofundaceae bacterium]